MNDPRLPHPLLHTTKSLTGFCLSKDTFLYIEDVWKRFTEQKTYDRAAVVKAFTVMYHQTLVQYDDPLEAEQAGVLLELLQVFEFVLGACTIYRTPPGVPVEMAIGVVNQAYRQTSAIALLEGVSADTYAWLVESWSQTRRNDFQKTTDADKSVRYLCSEMYSGIMQLVRPMVKTRMRSVKVADRRKWQLN